MVIPSVFHWSNRFYIDNSELVELEKDGIQRVYHKLLDIDWNPANGAHPVSVVDIPHQWRDYYGQPGEWTNRYELVPSIYITNNTFTHLDDAATDQLAHNLLRKLRMACPARFHGVLIDCDWTATTKARFFRLTRMLNDSLNVPVTATIRLHQYAHPGKTGVPPADRGMLMPYNVGKLNATGDVNSIFDQSLAEPYFSNTGPYPLPLDIALPAFSWGVQFRKGHFIGILQEAEVSKALELALLNGETHGTLQVVREDNERMPELHLGDEIRVERMTPELIEQAAHLAQNAVNSDTIAVAFFEVGTFAFQQLEPARVRSVLEGFGQVRSGGSAQSSALVQSDETVTDTVAADSAAWTVYDSVAASPFVPKVPAVEP